MRTRRNTFDVTNTVDVTEPTVVCREICRLYKELYPDASTELLEQAFADMEALFRGEYRGYFACDVPYHDIQHTLDVTLAAARLIAGHERQHTDGKRIGHMGALLCLICALFHDSGYIRRWSDKIHANGAELTHSHVTRGGRFLIHYLPTLHLDHAAKLCANLLHFTGYEVPLDQIRVGEDARKLGRILGTADLLAQMSDRCYLEKCRDRLYPEFVAAGLANPGDPRSRFATAEALLRETPGFFAHILQVRLEQDFGGVHRYLDNYFAPEPNLYIEEMVKNQAYINESVKNHGSSSDSLRRNPPKTLNPDVEPLDPSKYIK